jgi:formylglycine-generating enzyme required for sulfatase activity/energy-coupling factor transporter ATP-binding protein EcfA2
MGRERTMKKMTLKKATAAVLAWSLLGASAGQPAWAAGAKVVEVVPASFSGNGLGGISAGGAAANRIDALNLQPLLSQLSLQQLSVLHSEPLKTQPLVAQLMALQVQPIAALASFKASDDPANAALYQILGHPDAISEQRDALVPVIGQENFQKLLTTAQELNKLAGQNSALREALSSGANPTAALQRFKEHFDGAGELVAGLGNTAVVSGAGSGLKSPPSGLKKYEPRHEAPSQPKSVAGSAFQYIEKDGKKFLELKVGKIVRTMEMGSGGSRAPRVKFVRPDVLEVAVSEKPFMVKLTEDNLRSLATMMEYLSDPDASLTNLMLRGEMGTGKNTLVYTLAGLLNQGVRIMSFHAHTNEKDLRYRTTLGEERAGETSRKHSEIYESAEAGDWVILDEPNKPLQIGILNSLNTILQNRQETLPGEERPVAGNKRFRAIALVNPPNRSYTVQEMPADFIRRFNVLDVDYMKAKDEADFVMDTVFLDESAAKKAQLRPLIEQLVGLAGDLRSSYRQGHLPRPLSTRGVMNMAQHIKKFPKDFPYFREIFDPVYPTEYLEANEKTLVDEYLKQRNLQGQARPANFKLPDVQIDEKAGKVRLGDEQSGVVELPLGGLKAEEVPGGYRGIPHLQGNLRLWWAMMKDRALGRHSLVLGETGTGKTQLMGHFLYAILRMQPEEQTFTRQTRGQDITGKPELKNEATYWPPYPLERAVDHNTVWLVDEVTKPEDPGTVSLLNNVLQFGQILLPSGKVLNAKSGFGVVAMGTPARAQYEAQEFSGEVLDRFSTHILKPLPAEEEIGLVESYARQRGLAIDRPVLQALQKALDSLRDSYRQGLLPVPPSVQSLFRVVSRLGRFPDTKDDIVQTFLRAFPAWEKSHEDIIRLAMAPVAQALGLSPVTAKAQPQAQPKASTPTTAPAGTTASATTAAPTPAVPWNFRDDKEALSAFDEKVVGMAATFQTVPKGTFKMGSPASDKERSSDEVQHEVNIGYDYDMQTTPLTWGQLLRIVDLSTTKITIPDFAKDPKNSDGGKHETLQGIAVNSDHPVVNISWDDEQQIIDHLNSIQSEFTYRRPTEAEWERAARAGSQDSYSVKAGVFGTIAKALKEIAWFSENSGSRTHAVGKKGANKFGLRDMFGNVWEWMQDKYEGSYAGAPTDGSAFEGAGSRRVVRGGSWSGGARNLRSACRRGDGPGGRWRSYGARLVRSRR